MASNLILLVESHPTVVVSNQSEIVDFVMVYQNYVNTGDFYTNLVSMYFGYYVIFFPVR